MKYKGEKSLFISPDGGATVGYTQENDKGYVSVAYRKVYLEAGNYVVNSYFFRKLKYVDIDQDQMVVALVPATNTIEPLDYYDEKPIFKKNSVWNSSGWETTTSWSSISSNATISATGMYYLVFALMANEDKGEDQYIAFDDLKITRS
jgi:hypothetical protein